MRTWFLERDDFGAATLISILAYVGPRPQDALALRFTCVSPRRLEVGEFRVQEGKLVRGSKSGDHYRRSVELPGPVEADIG